MTNPNPNPNPNPNIEPVNKYPEMPKCPCFNDEAMWPLREAQMELLAAEFSRAFAKAATENNLCRASLYWFAGIINTTFAGPISNAPSFKDIPKMTKDQISRVTLGGLDALDQIHDAAVAYMQHRNKELMDEAKV